MAEKTPSEALREFHKFFNLPARDDLTLIDRDEAEFRQTLIDEEYEELEVEIWRLGREGAEPSLAHIYKELADLVYVCYGLDQHLGSRLSEVFAEVHRSNMTKLWKCWDCDGEGWFCDHPCAGCKGTGKRPKYREDGKVLKPPTYEPPDIERILNG